MNETAIFTDTESTGLTETNNFINDFHWCRHTLPRSVMISSSVVTTLLSLSLLNAMNGATYRYSRSQLRQMFYPTERKVAFLQYALFMPLFEVCVIWGAEIGVSADDSSASTVVTWLAINSLCLLVMTCACGAFGSYRLMIHAVQCFRMPLALMFMCDRVFNSVVGVESIFVALMFLCSVFEFFHVQDYFSVFSNARLDPFGFRNSRTHRNDDNDDDSFNSGPVLPNDAERNAALLATTRKRIMEQSQTTQDKGAVYFSASEEDEDEDVDESATEMDDRIPLAARAVFNSQKHAKLVARLLENLMRVDDHTDPQRVKRTVLKFKEKVQKLSHDDKASSSQGSRASEF